MRFTRSFLIKKILKSELEINKTKERQSQNEKLYDYFFNNKNEVNKIILICSIMFLFIVTTQDFSYKINISENSINKLSIPINTNIFSITFIFILVIILNEIVLKVKLYLNQFDLNNKILYYFKGNYHLIRITIIVFSQFLYLVNYFVSLLVLFEYNTLRKEIWKEFNFFIVLLMEIYGLILTFRLLIQILKVVFVIFMIPLLISSILLSYHEDLFNKRINKIIKTVIKKSSLRDNKIKNNIPFEKEKDKENEKIESLKDENELKDINENLNSISKRSSLQITCAICLCDIVDMNIISILPCSNYHSYHTICLQEWFNSNTSCPICRKDFSYLFISDNGENIRNSINNINRERFIELQEVNLNENFL